MYRGVIRYVKLDNLFIGFKYLNDKGFYTFLCGKSLASLNNYIWTVRYIMK